MVDFVVARKGCHLEAVVQCQGQHERLFASKQDTLALKKLVNHFPHNVGIIAIKLLRTDTTLDLSQKAEKSCF